MNGPDFEETPTYVSPDRKIVFTRNRNDLDAFGYGYHVRLGESNGFYMKSRILYGLAKPEITTKSIVESLDFSSQGGVSHALRDERINPRDLHIALLQTYIVEKTYLDAIARMWERADEIRRREFNLGRRRKEIAAEGTEL